MLEIVVKIWLGWVIISILLSSFIQKSKRLMLIHMIGDIIAFAVVLIAKVLTDGFKVQTIMISGCLFLLFISVPITAFLTDIRESSDPL